MAMQWQCSHCKAVFPKTDYWQIMPFTAMPGTIRCANCSAVYIVKDIQTGKYDFDETPFAPFVTSVANPQEPAREMCQRCGDELPGDDLDCPHCVRAQWAVIGCISAIALGLAAIGFIFCDSEAWRWVCISLGFVLFLVPASEAAKILLFSGKKLTQGMQRGRLAFVGLLACIVAGACIVICNALFNPQTEESLQSEQGMDEAGHSHRDATAGKSEKSAAATNSGTHNLNKPITENIGKIMQLPVVTTKKPNKLKLIEAVAQDDYNAVGDALKNGTTPNAINSKGTPVIILAAQKGNSRLVKLLLDYKANINARDSLKYTALMWAAARGRIETAKLLLKSGANPDLKNSVGESALTMASDAAMQGVINQVTNGNLSTPDAAGKDTAQ